jgi:hypothetical protein
MGQLGQLEKPHVQKKIAGIIEKSFDVRPMPSGNITQNEVDRRVSFAKETYKILWNDYRWSHQRIMDHLFKFLVMTIDGEDLPVEKVEGEDGSTMWGVDAAQKVEAESRLSAIPKEDRLIVLPHEVKERN